MRDFIFGVHPICEALRVRPESIVQIVLMKGRTTQNLNRVFEFSKKYQISIQQVDRNSFEKWIGKTPIHHQGIIAEIRERSGVRQYYLDEVMQKCEGSKSPGFLLLCDEIQDPHNLGALIRSAACANVNAIVIPKRGAAPVTFTVIKVSAGGIEHVPIVKVTNMNQVVKDLKERGFLTVGLSADAERTLYDVDLCQSVALIVGNEERGLRRMMVEKCDAVVKIPMPGPLDSLNASVAGGIALFEVVRQRYTK